MPKIKYIDINFSKKTKDTIMQANHIIDEYALDGLRLTLRQLYYQFVSRDLLPNKQSEYKRLGSIISDARLAGLIDWDAIEDRTRNLQSHYHNTDPGDAVQDALDCFCLDKWATQQFRPEVWIEKEALVGVISRICNQLDVPFFACKGYTSQSEMWRAAQRFENYMDNGQEPVVIHLGDHDPSGIDMTRDINERHELFNGGVSVTRIALNFDQIEAYEPPPNPAKLTDSRASGYISKFGRYSWELDALEPRVMRDLIKDTVALYTDQALMEKTLEQEQEYRGVLQNVVDHWETL